MRLQMIMNGFMSTKRLVADETSLLGAVESLAMSLERGRMRKGPRARDTVEFTWKLEIEIRSRKELTYLWVQVSSNHTYSCERSSWRTYWQAAVEWDRGMNTGSDWLEIDSKGAYHWPGTRSLSHLTIECSVSFVSIFDFFSPWRKERNRREEISNTFLFEKERIRDFYHFQSINSKFHW